MEKEKTAQYKVEGEPGEKFKDLMTANQNFENFASEQVGRFEKSEAEFINVLSLFYLRIMMIENNNNDVDQKSVDGLIDVKNKLQKLLDDYNAQNVSKKVERIAALKHITSQIDYILSYKDKDEKGETGSEDIKAFNAFVKRGAEIWEERFAQNI